MKPGLAEALCQWCEDLDYWRWKNFSPNFCSVLLSLFDAKQTQKHLTKNKRWIRVGGVRWVRRGVWIVSVSFIWFLYINVKCVCVCVCTGGTGCQTEGREHQSGTGEDQGGSGEEGESCHTSTDTEKADGFCFHIYMRVCVTLCTCVNVWHVAEFFWVRSVLLCKALVNKYWSQHSHIHTGWQIVAEGGRGWGREGALNMMTIAS